MGKNKLRPKPESPIKDPLPEPEVVSDFVKSAKKEETPSQAGDPQKNEMRKLRRERIRSVLDGSVLLGTGVQKYRGLFLYVFFWALLVITCNYLSENTVRKCAAIKNQLQELQFRQISSKAELMRMSRQSSVARMVDTLKVKESVVPPYIIEMEENED